MGINISCALAKLTLFRLPHWEIWAQKSGSCVRESRYPFCLIRAGELIIGLLIARWVISGHSLGVGVLRLLRAESWSETTGVTGQTTDNTPEGAWWETLTRDTPLGSVLGSSHHCFYTHPIITWWPAPASHWSLATDTGLWLAEVGRGLGPGVS